MYRREYGLIVILCALLVSVVINNNNNNDIGPSRAFAASIPTASMNMWSPHNPNGFDGNPQTTFTFSANAASSVGLVRLEWDFNGDGVVDATTQVSGYNITNAQITYVYGIDGYFNPAVRAVDINGAVSAWAVYDPSGGILLGVGWNPPAVTMDAWSPSTGDTLTTFTFRANATSDVGLYSLHWDFNGDGKDDAITYVSGHTATSSVTYRYPVRGIYTPQVRAEDVQHFVSGWSQYQLGGLAVTLDIKDGPTAATLTGWAPFSSNGPSGTTQTTFTFSADASAPAGIAKLEWDFGDGSAHAITSVSGAPIIVKGITTTHVYSATGAYTPQVRVIDINSKNSTWDNYNIAGTPVSLIIGPSTRAIMNVWSPHSNSMNDDGTPLTTFTFSANASSSSGIAKLEWDFGDGSAHAITSVSGAPTSVTGITTTHVYNAVGTYTPQVRAIAVNGEISPWSPYTITGQVVQLHVGYPENTVSVIFSPHSTTTTLPDGTTATTFTFTATSSLPAVRYAWDFNGRELVDQNTTTPSANHVYSTPGKYLPSVTVWDVYEGHTQAVPMFNTGTQVGLTVADPPRASMGIWRPHPVTGPDGYPTTIFTFSANASSSSGIAKLEWDFNGDGIVDSTTPITGAPTFIANVSATHAYGTTGTFTPAVRAVDIYNFTSSWDSLKNPTTGITLQLQVVAPFVNHAPIANAGHNQTVTVGVLVTLDGSSSYDPDSGDTISQYHWSEVSGPVSAALSSTNTTKPTFTPSVAGTYVFELTVTDNHGLSSSPARVTVTVNNASDNCGTNENNNNDNNSNNNNHNDKNNQSSSSSSSSGSEHDKKEINNNCVNSENNNNDNNSKDKTNKNDANKDNDQSSSSSSSGSEHNRNEKQKDSEKGSSSKADGNKNDSINNQGAKKKGESKQKSAHN